MGVHDRVAAAPPDHPLVDRHRDHERDRQRKGQREPGRAGWPGPRPSPRESPRPRCCRSSSHDSDRHGVRGQRDLERRRQGQPRLQHSPHGQAVAEDERQGDRQDDGRRVVLGRNRPCPAPCRAPRRWHSRSRQCRVRLDRRRPRSPVPCSFMPETIPPQGYRGPEHVVVVTNHSVRQRLSTMVTLLRVRHRRPGDFRHEVHEDELTYVTLCAHPLTTVTRGPTFALVSTRAQTVRKSWRNGWGCEADEDVPAGRDAVAGRDARARGLLRTAAQRAGRRRRPGSRSCPRSPASRTSRR